ncbi:bis(5'-nucleosyl)-tetraphosphatase (symmetrical) YqeK [Clostridium akagii]|uniref:bis(5'-nucleosyl)-tetraphosphatase (symmetrical) YqeK n=1 Tax=Clostridium akagii TaxID=91623 RepID=UPI0004787C00|nr:bis(5'-nucleosyl)-tetraphosphatase (symmetrical) YqeK [Clostridium akagii]
MWNEEQMRNYLKENLSQGRYNHSLGVEDAAEKLAKQYGANIKKAKIAGLIHDCAKEIDKKEILDICRKNGVDIDYVLEANPSLLHGAAGAIMAQKVMGVEDEDILSAIKNHTIGKSDMSLLEKVIYLADYIETSRKFPGIEELRNAAFRSLDEALILSFDKTIEVVISRGNLIHKDTVEARNFIICKVAKEKDYNK